MIDKPDCIECGGACCEDLVFPVDGLAVATRELLRVRANLVMIGQFHRGFAIESRCPKLDADGLCSIYPTRPLACVAYVPGGEACVATLKRRRTGEQRAKIWGKEVK